MDKLIKELIDKATSYKEGDIEGLHNIEVFDKGMFMKLLMEKLFSQAKQEPIAEVIDSENNYASVLVASGKAPLLVGTKLYIAPQLVKEVDEFGDYEQLDKDEIIRMAREVDAVTGLIGRWIFLDAAHLERFATLVAAHEREKLKTPHECQTEGEKTAFSFGWFKAMEQIEAAVLAEREVCAQVCDTMATPETSRDAQHDFHWAAGCCAAAIRARGEN